MILMFGDVHSDFSHVLPVVKAEKPAAIIFLGDIQAKHPLEQELAEVMALTEIYFIHGNHDTVSKVYHDNLFCSTLAARNLHGRVVEIDGLRVAGLGGIFRESVWYPKTSAEIEPVYQSYESCVNKLMDAERWKLYRQMVKEGKPPDRLPAPPLVGKALLHKSTIFWNDWKQLHNQQADILVTHEAPSCHLHGFCGIDALAQSMQVKYSFHGHHHDHFNYAAHEEVLGFSAHGVGLRGVSDMYGNIVLMSNNNQRKC